MNNVMVRQYPTSSTPNPTEVMLFCWLRQRQALQVQLKQLAETLTSWPISRIKDPACPLPHQLHRACELLMDYISHGHFEVYRHLVRRNRNKTTTQQQLIELSRSTDIALAFNDTFGNGMVSTISLTQLSARLQELRTVLAEHFLQEDNLVDRLGNL